MSNEEFERRMCFARQEASKAWCGEKTKNIDMDVELAEEFARILVREMYQPNLGCATTGMLIEEIKARVDLNYSTISTQ